MEIKVYQADFAKEQTVYLIPESIVNSIMDALDFAAEEKIYDAQYEQNQSDREEMKACGDSWGLISSRLFDMKYSGSIQEDQKLMIAETIGHTIEVIESDTKERGVANTHGDSVSIFIGSDDGSNDKKISRQEFNKKFTITSVICS